MNRAQAIKELASKQDRIRFLNALIESTKPAPLPGPPYGCQEYDPLRLCRFDRRALDRKCNGCARETDREYLLGQGLWIHGVSHRVDFQ
jgi:hypothetical protein